MFSKAFRPKSNWAIYPENSCPKVKGVASIKCVLPIFTTSEKDLAFFSNSCLRFFNEGIVFSLIVFTAAICIAVGKVSFEL